MDGESDKTGSYVLFGLIMLPLIYFGFFGMIILDEMVFRTYFFSNYVPLGNEGEEFLRLIYWPILKLMGLL
ncbi:hypothetical protein [Rubinisphaera sp.]|uniref:hypothetical protein n=1 Tax=Rubinisphaera sp. TaxID=2024857 RepID=UPI000C0FA96B|nr:hypothetical protein [Rubinisphaera sp.]MBV10284.1 hypothetical protein [Rubinisphaera sp.]HCS50674.1 hypothetical protein [Planctomycetaceae bacterium]|tara:strand:- start:1221 stop:1433 length:213 start_codon:yes stop_codon:yes gene_type:complete